MGHWTQYDEDVYRLPPGLKRIGYDADTGEYFFTGGWKSLPYCEYDVVPMNANTDASTSTSAPKELTPALKAILNPALPRRPSLEIPVSDTDPKEISETVTAFTNSPGDSDPDRGIATCDKTTASLSTSDTEDGSDVSLRRSKTWKEKVQDLPTRLKSSGSQLKRSLSSSSVNRRVGITIEQDTPPAKPPKHRHSPEPTLSPSRTISFSDLGLIKARDL
ncbi:hypothetical protein E1B28_012757 [Marasmius oreades]|nr:uncharacterized protein E1B28_012757 [Marasmius oreades]KAG7088793.1 hypothetical protein E1B28_012757 [Marasmius oreades]